MPILLDGVPAVLPDPNQSQVHNPLSFDGHAPVFYLLVLYTDLNEHHFTNQAYVGWGKSASIYRLEKRR